MTRAQWVYVGRRAGRKPTPTEKRSITAACERFVAEVLKPRFLPEVRPTPFNYRIDIYGKWHGNKYRFIERFRSDQADAIGVGIRGAVCATGVYRPRPLRPFLPPAYSYHRHTGEWLCLYQSIALAKALELIESDGHFHPV